MARSHKSLLAPNKSSLLVIVVKDSEDGEENYVFLQFNLKIQYLSEGNLSEDIPKDTFRVRSLMYDDDRSRIEQSDELVIQNQSQMPPKVEDTYS